ncbi:MAG: hypothetical protein COB37_06330 [Kordiimonadales bacterium]|nr:MAG: hypothetical protein COB37_06330 [Kordiimonadales bacterium]
MDDGGKSDVAYSEEDELADQFLDWTKEALVEMRQLVDALESTITRDMASIKELYDLSHNIKGLGASFDFELMTSIGASLCGYFKKLEGKEPVSKRALEAHVRAFEVVLSHKITGNGGDQGNALKLRLQAIIHEESAV